MPRTFSNSLLVGLLLLALVAGSTLITQGWTSRSAGTSAATEPQVERVSVEAVPVAVGRMRDTVHAVGTLEANESIILRPEVAGVVKRILFAEGQAVERGAVLVELDDAELRSQVEQASAELKIARLTYERMQQLVGTSNAYVSQQQIDQAISALATATARHSMYLTRLAKTKVRAPFAGYVGIRRISLGDYVQVGQDLVNLEDLSTLKIDFKVPEAYLNRLAPGKPIEVTTDAYPARVFQGEVYALDPRIDATSRSVRARGTIANEIAALRPGLFVTVTLTLAEEPAARLVPEEAIVHQREKTYVYRVVNEAARLTPVALGARERGVVQVLDGLGPEDHIVAVGHHKLKDGTLVQRVPAPGK